MIPLSVLGALEQLKQKGFAGYLVGGCVRDICLGRTPHDYDITTNALPSEIQTVFSAYRVLTTGIKHGTVTVLLDGTPLEITTFRGESDYSDHRHPDKVYFTDSLSADLARRDFTINAMAMDMEGNLIDPYGGRKDLQKGFIRCVGTPMDRFQEDALRILRGLRFSARFGFPIEEETSKAMAACAPLLSYVSYERIQNELTEMLCGTHILSVLLNDTGGVLCTVLPELAPMVGFDQRNPHHVYDVWTHTAHVVANVPPVPALRWAALLHDAGKPHCFSIDEQDIGHFYDHAKKSLPLAETILTRLRLDNATKERVLLLIAHHDTPIEPTQKAVRRWLSRLTREGFSQWIALKRGDNFGQSPQYRFRQQEYDKIEAIAAETDCFTLRQLAVGGNDLIALGIQPGPAMGALLHLLFEKVLSGELPNEKERLLSYVKENAELKSIKRMNDFEPPTKDGDLHDRFEEK